MVDLRPRRVLASPVTLALLAFAFAFAACGGGDDDDDDDDDVIADATDVDAAGAVDASSDAAPCGAGLECCRLPGDCDEGDCVSPGTTVCGGQCDPGPGDCAIDDDCVRFAGAGVGDPIICEPAPCTCEGFVGVCVPGCVDDEDCGDGEDCLQENHRCVAAACSVEDPCSDDFTCDRGTCGRRTCEGDEGCADGSFCVGGLCHGELGVCMLPAP